MRGPRRFASRAVLALAIACCLRSTTAHAGNEDGVLLGNDAAIVGGAVTADVHSGSALWYNPAGLMRVPTRTLDISARAYAMRFYRIPAFLTGPSGRSAEGNFNELVLIPSAASYVRPLGDKLRAGVGVFARESFDYTVASNLTIPSALSGAETRWQMVLANTSASYHLVLGLAGAVSDRLDLGVTLHVIYASSFINFQLGGGTVSTTPGVTNSVGLYAEAIQQSLKGVGIAIGTGLQWRPVDNVSLGVSIDSPTFLIVSTRQLYTTEGAVLQDADMNGDVTFAPGFAVQDEHHTDFGLEMTVPARLRAGLALQLGEHSLSAEIEVAHPLSNSKFSIHRRLLFNARAGWKMTLSPKLSIGAGLFTDRSPVRGQIAQFLDSKVDFYGGTVGLQYEKEHALAPGSRERTIGFGTTVGLRYAYGAGHIVGARVGDRFVVGENLDFQPNRTTLRIHEIALNLGGNVSF